MSYLANYNRGLGDVASDLVTLANDPNAEIVSLPSFSPSVFGFGDWTWREWALAAFATYAMGSVLFGGVKKRVIVPIRKRRRKSAKRREARERYEEELKRLA